MTNRSSVTLSSCLPTAALTQTCDRLQRVTSSTMITKRLVPLLPFSSESGPRQCDWEQGGDGRGETAAGLLHEEELHQRVWGVEHAHHEGQILVSAQVLTSRNVFSPLAWLTPCRRIRPTQRGTTEQWYVSILNQLQRFSSKIQQLKESGLITLWIQQEQDLVAQRAEEGFDTKEHLWIPETIFHHSQSKQDLVVVAYLHSPSTTCSPFLRFDQNFTLLIF